MSLSLSRLAEEPRALLGEKVIVTAALTGVAANRKQCPAIPYTPAEIGEEARRAADAGAAVVHIHAREDDGRPSHRVETYREIMKEVRKRSDVIINFSTGAVDIPREERVRHISDLAPEVGALNMGSMNYAKYNPEKKDFVFNWVFENSFDTIRFYLEAMRTAKVLPEMECFDTGHVYNIRPFIDMGLIQPPYQFSFIMGVWVGYRQLRATWHTRPSRYRRAPTGKSSGSATFNGPWWPPHFHWAATCAWAWRTTSTWSPVAWPTQTLTWWKKRCAWRATLAAKLPVWTRPGSCWAFRGSVRAEARLLSTQRLPEASQRQCIE